MDGGVAADAAAATGISMMLLLRGLAQVEGRGVKTVRSSTRRPSNRERRLRPIELPALPPELSLMKGMLVNWTGQDWRGRSV